MTADEIGKLPTPRTDAVTFAGDDGAYSPTETQYNVLADHACRQEQAIAALMEALQDAKHDIADAGWYSICDRYEGTLAAVREHLGEGK